MHRRLNLKLVGSLFVVVSTLIVSGHFVHAWQVGRNADVLFSQAERAKSEGRINDAIDRYIQYLRRRDNPTAYEHLSELLSTAAMNPQAQRSDVARAYAMFEEALRLHPELESVRRRLADLLLTRYGRIADAMKQYDELRKLNRDDVQLDVRYGQCEAALGHNDLALHVFYEVVGFNETTKKFDLPNPRGRAELDAYVVLADLLKRRLHDSEQANLVMHQMVAMNPQSFKAWLLSSRHKQRSGQMDEAAKDIREALKLAPDDLDVLLAAGELSIARLNFAEAREVLEHGLEKFPKNEAIFRSLATLALAEQKFPEAVAVVRKGLEQLPRSQALWLFLADIQLQQRDLEGAIESLAKLEKLAVRPDLLEFMYARLLMAQEKWLVASQKLERIRPLMADLPDIIKQVDLLLGEAYERLGQPDRELDIYHRALMRDPTQVAAKLGEARALTALGNTEQAIDSLYELQSGFERSGNPVPALVRNQLLQLRIGQQLRLPKEARDWREVTSLAREFIKDPTQSSTQKAIIRAELNLMQDRIREAKEILLAAHQEHPKDLSIWLSMLNLMQNDADPAATQRFIDRARNELGDIVPMRVAQGNLWVRIDGQKAKPRLLTLEEGLDKFTQEQQMAFWSDMGNLYYRLRDYENARRCWQAVAVARPEDPRLQQTIFELAVEFSQPEDMKTGQATLARLAGADSAMCKYADACQIVWEVRSKKAPRAALAHARRLITEAKTGRAEWYEIARLGAEIDELDNKTDDAITGYRRALDLSPGHVATARRLVELLYSRGRLAEARDALKLVGQTNSSDLMHKIFMDIERRTGKNDTALTLAEKAVEDAPGEASNRVWLAQLLDATGRTADAEQEFRQAVELQPESGMAWILLTHHLMLARKNNSAAELLPKIKQSVASTDLPGVLTQYFELVGDRENAERVYLERLAKNPNDTSELQGLVNFYLRTGQSEQLEKSVERLIEACAAGPVNEERDRLCWARRVKAQIYKNQGDFDGLQKAVKIVEENADHGKYSNDDTVFLATMLGDRPEAESRQKAVKLLEKLKSQGQLSDDLQARLAQLYERAGRWDKAREQLLNLLGRLGSNPTHMTTLALLQLKHGEIEDATRWIDKVVAVQPNSPQTTELRARLLAKQHRGPEAVKLIETLVPDPLPNDQLGKLGTAAVILEGIEEYDASEKMLRRLVAAEPRAELLLATFLGRHGDLEEAFSLLEKSRRSQPLTAIVGAGLSAIRKRHDEITPKQVNQLKRWIAAAVKESPDDPNVRLQEADLFDQTEQFDKVVESYRQALGMAGMKPQQAAVVKNNLAFVLALRNKPGDVELANGLIEEAIQTLGPSADLQDTRGMVLLSEGKHADAVRELMHCVDEGGSPTKYVHLAIAQEKSGDNGGARRSLKRANDMGFDASEFGRLERDRYNEMVKRLGSR